MVKTRFTMLIIFAALFASQGQSKTNKETKHEMKYKGICDASAVVAVTQDGHHQIIVGDDETNDLYVYNEGSPEPVDILRINEPSSKNEYDTEAAASIGQYQIWIGSHSRTKNGGYAKSRHKMFATTFNNGKLRLIKKSYGNLLQDLATSDILSEFDFARASEFPAEHPLGLNIEGLASNGSTLWIGLRGPLFDGKAMIISISNPLQMIFEGSPAEITGYELLDLDGRGIRDMVYDPTTSTIVLIAGRVDNGTDFSIYRWHPEQWLTLETNLTENLTPEGIWIKHSDNTGTNIKKQTADMFVLSDDGNWFNDSRTCRSRNSADRSFRVNKIPDPI